MHDSDLLACVSYMHTPPPSPGVTVEPTNKMAEEDTGKLKTLIKAYLSKHGAQRVFVWVDQACKGSRSESEFDWLSEGLMPYSVLPVLKVSGTRGLDDVCGRLWLKVELILGMNGSGVWWCDASRKTLQQHNASMHLTNPDHAVSAVCRSVLGGYTDDLSSYWKNDFLRLQIWSVRILLKDRGAARMLEYTRSASIEYSGPVMLQPTQVKKLLLEVATQPQYNPFGATAHQRERQGESHAWWTDLVPIVEINEVARDDRVFGCHKNYDDIQTSLRYVAMRTRDGVRYVGVPLSETPSGEIVIGALDVDGENISSGRVKWTRKVNLPGFESVTSDLALELELLRVHSKAGEQQAIELCRKGVLEIDLEFISVLVALGELPPYEADSLLYIPCSQIRW